MHGPTLPNVMLRLDTEKDVASQWDSRFAWTGLGFAALLLIGVLPRALVCLASLATVQPSFFCREVYLTQSRSLPVVLAANPCQNEPSHIAPDIAFSPVLPALNPGKRLPAALRSRSVRRDRRYAVMNAALLEGPVLSSGGPPPPPPPSDNRPRGGGGGGDAPFLSFVSSSFAVGLLDEWIGMVRVLGMGAQLSNGAASKKYTKSVTDLEKLREFSQRLPVHEIWPKYEFGQNMIMGMYSTDGTTVLALAACSLVEHSPRARSPIDKEVQHFEPEESLLIRYISVCPAELRAEASVANLQMRKGLSILAMELDVEIEFEKELLDPE